MALPFPTTPETFAVVHFFVVWLVSAFVIWLSAKMFVEKASFGTAAIAAIVGAAIFTIFSGRFLYSLIALVLWLFVLKSLFKVDWGKALIIAIAAWILGAIVGWLLGVPMIF